MLSSEISLIRTPLKLQVPLELKTDDVSAVKLAEATGTMALFVELAAAATTTAALFNDTVDVEVEEADELFAMLLLVAFGEIADISLLLFCL